MAGRRGDIDVVEPDRHIGRHLEIGTGGQQLLVDGLADHADQALSPLEPPDQLVPRKGRVCLVDVNIRPGSSLVTASAGRDREMSIEGRPEEALIGSPPK